MALARAKARFAKLPQWRTFSRGFRVRYDKRKTAPRYQHVFCGEHEIPGAHCYVADHPMLRFLSLDTRDPRLGLDLGPIRFVHLLYCWSCDVGNVAYHLSEDGVEMLGEKEFLADLRKRRLTLARFRKQLAASSDYPYADYPTAFPRRDARLVAVTSASEARQHRIELGTEEAPRGVVAHHQVGGLPHLAQGASYVPECEECEKPMAFVAAIADDCVDPRGFVDNSGVQVLYFLCVPCRRIQGTNVCD